MYFQNIYFIFRNQLYKLYILIGVVSTIFSQYISQNPRKSCINKPFSGSKLTDNSGYVHRVKNKLTQNLMIGYMKPLQNSVRLLVNHVTKLVTFPPSHPIDWNIQKPKWTSHPLISCRHGYYIPGGNENSWKHFTREFRLRFGVLVEMVQTGLLKLTKY